MASIDAGTASTLSGFEGPEKLLEIWFKKPSKEYQERPNEKAVSLLNESIDIQNASVANCMLEGLRTVHPNIWKDMLKIVKCQVLSTLHNEHVDAYLLSESSMFIFSHRLTLKTCGTTTLLNSVGRILEIAKEYCGLESIDAVFYSRKAFLFPEKQAFPHGNWSAEVYIELIQVSYLDGIFEADKYDTAGYVIGKVNGDHWCLYLATPLVADNNGNQLSVREVDELNEDDDDDITLEILMQDLDPDAMKEFWRTKEELIEGKLDHNINVEKQRLSNPMRIYVRIALI
jgi:S-adenosylmethionine decarboxylase